MSFKAIQAFYFIISCNICEEVFLNRSFESWKNNDCEDFIN